MPRTAILYIAQRCNQSCVFCLEEDRGWAPFQDPATSAVTEEIERLFARGARHITFMGGETFFRKDLPEILAHARSVGFTRVGVTTNGTVLAKPGFIRELQSAGLAFIELSVHGHTVELSNLIAGTHYTHQRQSLALDEIRAAGLPTILNVVVCRANKDHLVEIVRYVSDRLAGVELRFKLKFVSLQGLAAAHAEVEEPLRYEDVDVAPVAAELVARGLPFWFYNFPLCRLGPYAARSLELGSMAADESYFDYDHRGARGYYETQHQLDGRVWPAGPCAPCTLRAICPGLEESYRRVAGEAALGARDDDPLPLVTFARADHGGDAAGSGSRLRALAQAPRPARFEPSVAEGRLIRFRHSQVPQPLDLEVELASDVPSFSRSPRFALRYRSWPDEDASRRPLVEGLLAAAARALEQADGQGVDLAGARAAVAATELEPWRCEGAPATEPMAKPQARLSVIGRTSSLP